MTINFNPSFACNLSSLPMSLHQTKSVIKTWLDFFWHYKLQCKLLQFAISQWSICAGHWSLVLIHKLHLPLDWGVSGPAGQPHSDRIKIWCIDIVLMKFYSDKTSCLSHRREKSTYWNFREVMEQISLNHIHYLFGTFVCLFVYCCLEGLFAFLRIIFIIAQFWR